MPSFILRDLDPSFWTRVQTKAKAEGTTVKAVILKLLAQWLGMLALVLFTGCHTYIPPPLEPSTAVVIPDPTPTPTPPSASEPFALSLYVSPSNVMRGRATNLILSIGGASPVQPMALTWTFGDGQTGHTAVDQVPHTYRTTGTFTATVTLVDAEGRSGTATTKIQVQNPPPGPEPTPPPAPPTPSYTVTVSASPSTGLVVNDSTTLTATATAVNGAPTPTSYAWDCANDGTAETTTPGNTHICTYPTAGPITSSVTVTGGTASGSGTTTVTVAAAATLYVEITADTLTPSLAAGGAVTFTATVTSTGAVPPLLQWQWDDTNDGTVEQVIATAASPNVRSTNYGSTGAKTVKVRIVDGATGREAPGFLTITVGP
jgi:PKD repeat protein